MVVTIAMGITLDTVMHLEFFQKHVRNWFTSIIRCKKGKAPTQPGLLERAGFDHWTNDYNLFFNILCLHNELLQLCGVYIKSAT